MRVRVLGAGVIGLSVAEELQRRGHAVEVVDRSPGAGASRAAAGMLAPGAEVWHGEAALLDLGRRSLELWPTYAARLGVRPRRTGTLLVGADHDDLQQVERQADLLAGLGHHVDLLDRRALLAREPTLLPGICGGFHLVDEHSVDPREVVAALRSVVPVQPEAGTGPVDVTVLATGSRLPDPWRGLVRGVRGEIVRVRSDGAPRHTIRGWVHGEPVYVVPRVSGEVVVGATSEEHDAPPIATVGGVVRLLHAARSLVPGLDRAEVTEVMARDRPAAPDNLPLIGPAPEASEDAGSHTLLAAGLHRHGVLLAPLTAVLIADQIEHGDVEPVVDPRRFVRDNEERNAWRSR